MAHLGQHKDAWGNTTKGCEASLDHSNHGSWSLCKKPRAAIGVYRDGERYLCAAHVRGALRKRTFYADEIQELRTLDGVMTHRLVRERGRKGRMVAVSA